MNHETMAQALEQLEKLGKTYMAYTHALGVMELDAATAAPKGSWEGRGITAGVLSEVMYDLIANPENGELLSYLKEHREKPFILCFASNRTDVPTAERFIREAALSLLQGE